MTQIINLIGSSGSGKSTGAAYIFSHLKIQGVSCEIITEVAKELTWAERKNCLQQQLYVLGNQSYKQNILDGKVDYIITDSPLILSAIYAPKDFPQTFYPFIIDLFKKQNNMNFFINRIKRFEPKGRNETELESNRIANTIKSLLIGTQIPFVDVDGDERGYNTILEKIL